MYIIYICILTFLHVFYLTTCIEYTGTPGYRLSASYTSSILVKMK